MDLAELAMRTGLERRKLRYVLDHRLVPRLHIEIKDDALGRPRHFAPDVGFGIACAAKLQESGLPHDTIRGFLSALIEIKFRETDELPALAYVLQRPVSAYVDWGDDRFVRLRVLDLDSGWWAADSGKQDPTVDPQMIHTLNVGSLRQQIFGSIDGSHLQ